MKLYHTLCILACLVFGYSNALTVTPNIVYPGLTVRVSGFQTASKYYFYVGSAKTNKPCRSDGFFLLCIIPEGVKLGPQHVAFNRSVSSNDETITVLPKDFDFYMVPQARQAIAESLEIRPILSSGTSEYFTTERSSGRQILRAGRTQPPGLTAAAWQKTLDYLNNRQLLVRESRIGQTLNKSTFVSADTISIKQLQDLSRLQRIGDRKPILPVLSVGDSLKFPDISPRPISFETVFGRSINDFRSEIQSLRLPNGILRYSPREINRITDVAKNLNIVSIPLSNQPKPDPEEPTACTEARKLERDVSISDEGRIEFINAALAIVGAVGVFDPNTDPWGSINTTQIAKSNVVPLERQIVASTIGSRAYLIDTWNDTSAIDRYENTIGKGHGIIVSQIVKARAQVNQNAVKSLGACDGENCQSTKVIEVIDQICSAIADHQVNLAENVDFKSIINLSLSFPIPSVALESAIRLALKNGIYVIVSHGNISNCLSHKLGDQCNAFPADYTNLNVSTAQIEASRPYGRIWSVTAQLNGGTYLQPAKIARYWLTQVTNGQPLAGVMVPTLPALYAPYDFTFTYPNVNQAQGDKSVKYPSSYIGTSFSTAYATGTILWYVQKCKKFPSEQELQELIYSRNSGISQC